MPRQPDVDAGCTRCGAGLDVAARAARSAVCSPCAVASAELVVTGGIFGMATPADHSALFADPFVPNRLPVVAGALRRAS